MTQYESDMHPGLPDALPHLQVSDRLGVGCRHRRSRCIPTRPLPATSPCSSLQPSLPPSSCSALRYKAHGVHISRRTSLCSQSCTPRPCTPPF